MFFEPISQFFDAIIPTYKQYVELSEKRDNKKFMLMHSALQAAQLLFHYRETLEQVYPKLNLDGREVSRLCPDYYLLGRVCDKSKHSKLRSPGPLKNDATAIEETIVSTYFPHIENAQYSKRWYGVMQYKVMINFDDGSTRDFLEIATNVINFWSEYLVQNGVVNRLVRFTYEGDRFLNYEEVMQIGMNLPIHPQEIGGAALITIGRVFKPLENKFYRLPFRLEDGRPVVIPNPVDDLNRTDLKVYWSFLEMTPPPTEAI